VIESENKGLKKIRKLAVLCRKEPSTANSRLLYSTVMGFGLLTHRNLIALLDLVEFYSGGGDGRFRKLRKVLFSLSKLVDPKIRRSVDMKRDLRITYLVLTLVSLLRRKVALVVSTFT
jgi:hypothetical protein